MSDVACGCDETNKGTIRLDLYDQKTPMTVANFVNLARRGFYDGLSFHRVIADFMIQVAALWGQEQVARGIALVTSLPAICVHDAPGKFSMANAGPGTNGSQFFITHVETPWLDDAHTIFGAVQSDADQEVVNAIAQGDQIVSVTIEGDAAELLASVPEVQEWNAQLDG
ncbi:MAG: peptidyl-prolyl cis-trans isomerase [Pseudomonadota bacterium]|nr:MAG: peptidyl-prolyl cis-trans isomerase [Pseudomonadota bacterium]